MTIYRKIDDASYSVLPFPMKLHEMLEDSERLGFDDIVSWHSSGKFFKVFEPVRFQNEIMKEYFNHSKLKSFQRQLNIYGFKRIQTGHSKGGYVHKDFVRGAPELSENMTRKPPSSCNSRHFVLTAEENRPTVELEPLSFFGFTSSSSSSAHLTTSKSTSKFEIFDSEVKPLYDFFFPEDPSERVMISSLFHDDCMDCGRFATLSTVLPSSEPRNFESLLNVSTLNDDDFNNFLPILEESVSDQSDSSSVTIGLDIDEEDCENNKQVQQVEELSFPWKLHLLLEDAKKENYQHIVSWIKDCKAFKVHDTKEFVVKIMPNYFDQTKYESFRRQLNLYGFHRIGKGVERGVISHPNFVEGCPWMCKNIAKK